MADAVTNDFCHNAIRFSPLVEPGSHFILLDGGCSIRSTLWLDRCRPHLQIQNSRSTTSVLAGKWAASGVHSRRAKGFSNPFNEATGPTAWEPPLYPFLIAGVFKLFGVYTHASALVLLGLNSLFSALTCVPIFLIAKRCFSDKLAIWTDGCGP